jgi:6-pyruvoyltetrahydropterin/6-carboxytetrahydropterin synthase
MPERYHIRIEKERLTFSAAHFITYDGDLCEPLHGHNWHVAAELEGPLDENRYVVDFIAVRDTLQQIVDSLDHRVLLPTDHPTIHIAISPGGPAAQVAAKHGEREWLFPAQDCVLLPVTNTTAELVAKYIADELRQALAERLTAADRVSVAVDECDGQWGVYTWQAESRR